MPILQLSSVTSVRPSSGEDVVENSDSAKDFELSDLFAALVDGPAGESVSEEHAEELPVEKVIPESMDEQTAKVPNPNQPEASEVEYVAQERQDQNMSVESIDTPTISGVEVPSVSGELSAHLPVSAAFTAIESRPSDPDAKGLTESVKAGKSNPEAQAVISGSQSHFRQPAENHAVPGFPTESSSRMQSESPQAARILVTREKPEVILSQERPVVSAQSQPTPVQAAVTHALAHVAKSKPGQIQPQEPRIASHSRRVPEGSANKTTLTPEFETPQTANKQLAAGQVPAPMLTTGPLATGQIANPMLDKDDGLRAGLVTGTEHHLQSTSSEAIHRGTHSHSTEIARSIGRQLADIIQQIPGRPVEVALSPEELGRVRMSISTHDTGITLALLAERPETLDLMRRHIDQLTQEFHALGFGDVRFSFSQNNESDGGSAESMKEDSSSPTDSSPAQTPIQLSMNPSSGLDLRL